MFIRKLLELFHAVLCVLFLRRLLALVVVVRCVGGALGGLRSAAAAQCFQRLSLRKDSQHGARDYLQEGCWLQFAPRLSLCLLATNK